MAKVVSSLKESIQIAKLLDEHCHPILGREGYFQYDDDWDDRKIAEVVGRISANSVANHRQQLKGKLGSAVVIGRETNAEIRELTAALAELTTHHNALAIRFNNLCETYNILVTTLSVNRVVDAKHLKVHYVDATAQSSSSDKPTPGSNADRTKP